MLLWPFCNRKLGLVRMGLVTCDHNVRDMLDDDYDTHREHFRC